MGLHSSSPRQHMGAGKERPISLLGSVSIPVVHTFNPFYTHYSYGETRVYFSSTIKKLVSVKNF